MYGRGADTSGWLCDFGYFMPGPFGMFFSILLWGAIILLIVKVVQSLFFSRKKTGISGPMKILQERYAAGEISRDEYERVKQDIS